MIPDNITIPVIIGGLAAFIAGMCLMTFVGTVAIVATFEALDVVLNFLFGNSPGCGRAW